MIYFCVLIRVISCFLAKKMEYENIKIVKNNV